MNEQINAERADVLTRSMLALRVAAETEPTCSGDEAETEHLVSTALRPS